MAIIVQQGLQRHPEIFGRLPRVGAQLHLPCRSGVAEDVGRHVGKSSLPSDIAEGLVHVSHGRAVPLHGKALPCPFPPP